MFDIVPGPEWGRAARDLRSAAKLIEREIQEGLKKAAGRTKEDVRSSALSKLPQSGGLAAEVARTQISVRAASTGRSIRVSLEAQSRFNIDAINDGSVMHPVYGNRKTWVRQSVTPDWFTDPIKDAKPDFAKAIRRAVTKVINRLE